MKRSLHCAILTLAASAAFILPTVLAAEKPAKLAPAVRNKIVFQISDDDQRKWSGVLINAKNVQQDLGVNNVVIAIVVYGSGLGMLTFDSPVGSEVAEAISTGIEFVACENTMKGQHLTRDDMLPSLHYAPAAIVELMKKQQQGYAYIKP